MTSETLSESRLAADVQLRAAEWVIERYEVSQWNAERQAALDIWLAESPTHLLAYWRLKAAWESTHRLAALRNTSFGSHRAVKTKSWRPLGFRLLAATTVLAVAGVWMFSRWPTDQEKVYVTPVGGRETITLADGSKIELNTATEIRVRPRTRFVRLIKGEAFFQVRHNALKPFIVLASDHRIMDVGTKFLMKDDGRRLQVTLIEGSVRFESANAKVRTHSEVLKPGDVAVATVDAVSVIRKSPRSIADASAWRKGMLVFRDATLADAAAEFNRYNREQMVIENEPASRIRIDGTFHADNISGFTNMAEHVFELRVHRHGNEIVISN